MGKQMSLKEYRRMKNKNPKYSEKVVGCPHCWGKIEKIRIWGEDMSISEFKRKAEALFCFFCKREYNSADVLVFDSKMEHRAGLEFKLLEQAGRIQGLIHHEGIQLMPYFYVLCRSSAFREGRQAINGIPYYLNWEKIELKLQKQIGMIQAPFVNQEYETDFTYLENEKKVIVEVKKEETVWVKKKGGKIRVTRPFFPPGQSVKKLSRVNDLLSVQGLEVLVYTGRWWGFERGRLVEVV